MNFLHYNYPHGQKRYKKKNKGIACPQRFAVLATTSRDTRKSSYMVENNIVSLLVDDRQGNAGDLFKTSAVTAMGEAEVADKNDRQYSMFLEKSPQLKDFLALPSTSLIRVNVISYYLVIGFNKVYQLPAQ